MADGETLARLINAEKVNYSLGVPIIWLAFVNYLEQSGESEDSLNTMVVGGSACPLLLMHALEKLGVWADVGWGMTEMSPLGICNRQTAEMRQSTREHVDQMRVKAGRSVFGVEMKIVDHDDRSLPRDGRSSGLLKVRGPWVCSSYFRGDQSTALEADGWFDTGDMATIDRRGTLTITDRVKGVIKSGGEWISSIDVENAAIAHPDVREAAVIGIADEK